jgi:hypothetical protein
MKTLLLDRDAWDLAIDAAHDIALASEPYAVLQDVASACRLFAGELWFDTTRGIPYLSQIFATDYPLALLKEDLIAAAVTVPGVDAATVFLDDITNRGITGQIQCVTTGGTLLVNL